MIRIRNGTILIGSGALLLIAAFMHLLSIPLAKEAALISAAVLSGYPIARKALQALFMKAFSIELLVTVAVIGAFMLGEYVEAGAVTFLFMLGAYLEAKTLEKTRSALKKLIAMAPVEATVLRDGIPVKLAAEEVKPGDRVIVRSGERVAVDGTVADGQAYVNEAAVTGESVPVGKERQDRVLSGTTVDTGYLEVIAERVGADTTFARMIELVEEAQESKATSQKFLEKFAAYYTPSILILAAAVYLFTRDVELALTFLVIACPGALVISAPVSIVAGIGNGARNGVLIKGGVILEKLSKINTVVFDKTGTLTLGRPTVTAVRAYGRDESAVLALAAELETASEHPLGRAIVAEAMARELPVNRKPEQVEVEKGHGLRGRVDGEFISAGNRRWMERNVVSIPEDVESYMVEQEAQGNTAVLIAVDGSIAGVISIADQVRNEAADALLQLKRAGIRKTVMLTGDNRFTAQRVAAKLGIDHFKAELLPEDKVADIRRMKQQGDRVAMVGDGINDAPAIATADIGIAMGGGGTDIAIETADVVIMADKLNKLGDAVILARATVRNMKQNMGLAVAVVVLLLAGVLSKNIFLASGMFIHEFSVLLVILNAIRLVRFKPKGDNRHGKLQSARHGEATLHLEGSHL